jgi:hypothetical protein
VLEVALTTLFVAVAVVTLGHRRSRPVFEAHGEVVRFAEDDGILDLPCPWCTAATCEDDRHCPDCGQPFG